MAEKDIGIVQEKLVSGGEVPAKKLPQYVAALTATLGALAAGMVLGWTSSTPRGEKLADEWDIPINEDQFSWIGSIFNLGAATICIPIGILSDIIGRKKAMLLLTIPFTLGWLLIIFSYSVTMFYVGRYILGISGGAFCVTAPMYTAEIGESSIRGTLGSYFQLMLTIGILLTYTLGSMVSMKMLSILSGIVPLIFCAVFVFMPESPVYLLKKGKLEAARASYKWLRGENYDIDSELKAQNNALAEAEENKVSFLISIQSKAAKKGLFIAFGLMFFQQLSGVNAIIFYAGGIFEQAGSRMDKDRQSIIVGIMQVVAVFISTLIVDRLGRRILLLVSSAFMSISAITIGFYFHFQSSDKGLSSISFIPLIATCVFIVLFSIGFGPIPWLYQSEIFAPQIKGIASSSACLLNWFLAFIVTNFYQDFTKRYGSDVTFWLFSGICALAYVFVHFIPETSGKSLQNIQMELGGGEETKTSSYANYNSNSRIEI